MKFRILLASVLLMVGLALPGLAQKYPHDGRLYLGSDSTHYFKFTMVNQAWLRFTQTNPGSQVFGYDKKEVTDIGIRRFRIQAYGQLTDRVFIYAQLGINNFNYIADRKSGGTAGANQSGSGGFFLHDATGEYAFVKTKLSLGMGLTAWSGLARFASPSVGTIMGIDAPLYQQATNDVTDQFLRKLSIYAKGKLGKFDYRVTMASPMAYQKSASYSATAANIGVNSSISLKPPKMQMNGYFQWQFLDQESNLTPYMTGTYLGTKKVFNIGAGFVYQPDAMWHRVGTDSVSTAMRQIAVDVFYDAPVGQKGSAVSAYASYTNFDFGPNYIRNNGPMNPTNGLKTGVNDYNGTGNQFPLVGTGNVIYAQVGYKFPNNMLGTAGTLMPYVSTQQAKYDHLADPMRYYDAGINWLLAGHTSKFTVAYQSRPIYTTNAAGTINATDRKGAIVMQYQVFFN